MGQLPKDLGSGVHELLRQIHPNDLKNPTFEAGEQPHVTVLYGLHTKNPEEVFSQIKRSGAVRPATMHLGKIDLFRHRDQDVLKINVESSDLHHLNGVVKKLPNSYSFPSYEPHVTVAYLKPGTGEKYLGLKNPLEGREATLGGLVFSTPERKYHYIPLRAPRVEDIIELAMRWGFPEDELVEMTTAMSVGTTSRPFGFARPIFPSIQVKASPRKSVKVAQGERCEGQSRRKLRETFDPSNFVNYSDIPYHLQVMDHIEGEGWEHVGDEPKHSVFAHAHHPGAKIRVIRRDEHPIWRFEDAGHEITGSDISGLSVILKDLPEEDPE